jgi:hypothetical protein
MGVSNVPQAVVVDGARRVVARGKVWEAWEIAGQTAANQAASP